MATLNWDFTTDEINAVEAIVDQRSQDPFVTSRRTQNVEITSIEVSESRFWDAHLAALLTSRQRSGPESQVFSFLKDDIRTLSLDRCRDADDVSDLVATTLEEYGGILYYNNIGSYCERNLTKLDSEDGWGQLRNELDELIEIRKRDPTDTDHTAERRVSRFLHEELLGEGLHGIGPKQSRNLLQILGLSRYETPLDSRITKWINENLDLPYRISGSGLSHSEYYAFVMDVVQDVCSEAGVLPCLFDAAVFSSYDTEWSENDAKVTF
jgi:hypothetical protein